MTSRRLRRLQPPKLSLDEWRAIAFTLGNQAWLSDYLYNERLSAGKKVEAFIRAHADPSHPEIKTFPHL